MSSLEALLPDDLEKHVQLNRARLNSYGVLGEEIKAYCECGGHATECADITRKTVGARRTPTKVVRKGSTGSTNARMQRMLTLLTRRNQQMLNQKLKSVDSAWVITTLILLMCKSLDGSRLNSTQVQERRHGPTQCVTYGKKLPNHVDLTFRTATGELVKSGERLYVEGCDGWGVNLRVRGVQAPVCLLESSRRWVELSCVVTKVTCSTEVRMSRRE